MLSFYNKIKSGISNIINNTKTITNGILDQSTLDNRMRSYIKNNNK
jgi:hypothetical protein